MRKYGESKYAYFGDGVIIQTDRVNFLKRCVRMRRNIEGYFGPVWFRPCNAWLHASGYDRLFARKDTLLDEEENRPSYD